MLKQLSILNFVLVAQLEILFESGLTVLTGETGAGKSILIDAIAFGFGEKADTNVIRVGSNRADVTMVIDISSIDHAQHWLKEQDIDEDDTECIVRRVIDSSGRSRGYINGRPISMSQLRAFSEFIIDISGQHAHQLLLRPEVQRQTLDAQGGLLGLVEEVSKAYTDWRKSLKKFNEATQQAEAKAEEIKVLQWEIEDVTPHLLSPEEWLQLEETHRRQAYASTLTEKTEEILQSLSESDQSVSHELSVIRRTLQSLIHYDETGIEPLLKMGEEVDIALTEWCRSLQYYRDGIDMDAFSFEQIEQKMEGILSVCRKYRIEPQQMAAHYEGLLTRLNELEMAVDIKKLEQTVIQKKKHYDELAIDLTAQREKTAKKLSDLITQALGELGMESALFDIQLTSLDEPHSHGKERIDFMLQANAGGTLRPLNKVVSGGELSRIGLAISTVTSKANHAPILVFDEVDAGIGGQTGNIVGRMLKTLGKGRQVFCITHLPQVAVYADHQLRVDKVTAHGNTQTHITLLQDNQRVTEIARMLGAESESQTSLLHAEEMLKKAQ